MQRPSRYIGVYMLVAGCLFFFCMRADAQQDALPEQKASEKWAAIGHHKLFISQSGQHNAKFTIVFISGAGGSSSDWTKVIRLLPSVQTIAYDRAGAGKSEKGVLPETMAQEVMELHALLDAVEIKGPVILVGQSLGGLIARMYTEQFGKNIAGIVLVDPTHESGVLGSMKYGGWVRLREKAVGKPIPKPQLSSSTSTGYDSTADYLAEEFQLLYLSAVKNPKQLGNRPLMVIGAGIRKQPPGTPDEQWQTLKTERDNQVKELTSLSDNAKFVLDMASSHGIQNDNPGIVAASIQMVIHSIETKGKL